ncbi:MAG: T9SS type A sorting domain-containing protein [Bacteroidetes bacterium]|nr:T9SS type A sorting domain-containing protein [Bacteroidota bacterium]
MTRLTILFLLFTNSAIAQPLPFHQFTFPTDSMEVTVTDLVADEDGMLYILASRRIPANFDEKAWVAAYDHSGNRQWEFTWGEKFGNPTYFLAEWGPDHLVAIVHPEDSTGTFNVAVLKLTKAGSLVWSYYYGKMDGRMDIPTDYTFDQDQNLIISAGEHSTEAKQLLLKLSPDGVPVFTKTRSFPETNSSSYLLDTCVDSLGNVISFSRNLMRETDLVSIVKHSPDGDFLWAKSFDFWPTHEIRRTQLITIGTDILFAGPTYQSGVGGTAELNIVRLDENGTTLSHKTHSMAQHGFIQSILSVAWCAPDRYLMVPMTFTNGKYSIPMLIVDGDGNLISKFVPEPSAEIPSVFVMPPDQNQIVVYSYGSSIQKTVFGFPNEQSFQIQQFPAIPAPQYLAGLTHDGSLIWGFSDRPFEPTVIMAFDQPTLTTVPSDENVPAGFKIRSVYPNPFNPSTMAEIELTEAGPVSWSVCDVTGRMALPVTTTFYQTGRHSIPIHLTGLSSGLYFLRIHQGATVQTAKLAYIR